MGGGEWEVSRRCTFAGGSIPTSTPTNPPDPQRKRKDELLRRVCRRAEGWAIGRVVDVARTTGVAPMPPF